jgi:hypothetical protein
MHGETVKLKKKLVSVFPFDTMYGAHSRFRMRKETRNPVQDKSENRLSARGRWKVQLALLMLTTLFT